jgi:hypothetical protein
MIANRHVEWVLETAIATAQVDESIAERVRITEFFHGISLDGLE